MLLKIRQKIGPRFSIDEGANQGADGLPSVSKNTSLENHDVLAYSQLEMEQAVSGLADKFAGSEKRRSVSLASSGLFYFRPISRCSLLFLVEAAGVASSLFSTDLRFAPATRSFSYLAGQTKRPPMGWPFCLLVEAAGVEPISANPYKSTTCDAVSPRLSSRM